MHAPTVYLIDDDPSIRDATSLLLSLQGQPSACFANAEDFLGALKPEWQGCVVADIRMSGMSGLELQARLQACAPHLPVIIITAHGDVGAARQAFLNRAVDFLEKPFEGEQLLRAVQRALQESAARQSRATAVAGGPGALGSTSLTQPAAADPRPPGLGLSAGGESASAQPATPATQTVLLSPREAEVMQLLIQGLHNRAIAEALGISHRTVEIHKARVLDKLNVRNVVELVRLMDQQPVAAAAPRSC